MEQLCLFFLDISRSRLLMWKQRRDGFCPAKLQIWTHVILAKSFRERHHVVVGAVGLWLEVSACPA